MTQYSKSGPPVDQKSPADSKVGQDDVRKMLSAQQDKIDSLEKEVRRLKQKLDRHADYLNKLDHGQT